MIRFLLAALLIAIVFPTQAKTWGPASAAQPGFEREAALDDIFARLVEARNADHARIITDEMWKVFLTAPDEATAELLNQALRARGGYNFEKALGLLDQVIEKHPNYAEGWNQRAYIHFVRKRYDQSLADCEKALALQPRHLGCLSGMARVLIRHQKKYIEGEKMLRRALELHPQIYEQKLLGEIPREKL